MRFLCDQWLLWWNCKAGTFEARTLCPPYQFNLIGNSDATPLIRQDDIIPDEPYQPDPLLNLQHDDSYCANHLLFDDWFLSSIAPQPAAFARPIAKEIDQVYRDFLMGGTRLTNRSYKPIPADQGLTAEEVEELAREILESPEGDGWLRVGSRFEVEGMFNVNSTSVKAWRAILGHARKQQVAYHSGDGITLDPEKSEHVVSRHTIAANVKAGEDPRVGANFPSGSEYTGFRSLSDSQLDELAEEMVVQVRERGLKRDLSTLLEREIDPSEVYELSTRSGTEFTWPTDLTTEGEDFLLYGFDDSASSTVNNTTAQATVPIQDLASYYQLYNSYRSDSMGGFSILPRTPHRRTTS